jgi:hypothetical protein
MADRCRARSPGWLAWGSIVVAFLGSAQRRGPDPRSSPHGSDPCRSWRWCPPSPVSGSVQRSPAARPLQNPRGPRGLGAVAIPPTGSCIFHRARRVDDDIVVVGRRPPQALGWAGDRTGRRWPAPCPAAAGRSRRQPGRPGKAVHRRPPRCCPSPKRRREPVRHNQRPSASRDSQRSSTSTGGGDLSGAALGTPGSTSTR